MQNSLKSLESLTSLSLALLQLHRLRYVYFDRTSVNLRVILFQSKDSEWKQLKPRYQKFSRGLLSSKTLIRLSKLIKRTFCNLTILSIASAASSFVSNSRNANPLCFPLILKKYYETVVGFQVIPRDDLKTLYLYLFNNKLVLSL